MEPPEPVKRCLPDLWNIFMWLREQNGPQEYLVKVYCKRFPGKEAAIINQALSVYFSHQVW